MRDGRKLIEGGAAGIHVQQTHPQVDRGRRATQIAGVVTVVAVVERDTVSNSRFEGIGGERSSPEVCPFRANGSGWRKVKMDGDCIVPRPIGVCGIGVVVAGNNALVSQDHTSRVGKLGCCVRVANEVATGTRPAPQLRDRGRQQTLPVDARHGCGGWVLVPPCDARDVDSRSVSVRERRVNDANASDIRSIPDIDSRSHDTHYSRAIRRDSASGDTNSVTGEGVGNLKFQIRAEGIVQSGREHSRNRTCHLSGFKTGGRAHRKRVRGESSARPCEGQGSHKR